MFVVAADTEYGQELTSIREGLNLSKTKFAELLGVERHNLRNWELGTSERVPQSVIEKARTLMMGKSDLNPISENFGKLIPVPIVGKASAGDGEFNVDVQDDYAYVPPSLAREDYVHYIIDGDSMMPHLRHGDLAVFKQSSMPRKGFTYLVKKTSGEFRCKNLEWRDDRWTLVSTNPAYEPEPLDDSTVLGYLVAYYRNIQDYEELKSRPKGLKLEDIS